MLTCPRLRMPRVMRLARSLASCTSGVAMIEFAMSLPVLLTLGLAGMETANYAMANLKVSNIAMLTADNAARVRDSIDESDVAQLLTGAKMTGAGIDFGEHGRIILSSVEPNTAGWHGASTGQWIRWQRCDGALDVDSAYGDEGKGEDDSSLPYMGSSTRQISAAAGTAVMVVEVYYDYQPLLPASFLAGRRIHYESAFNVRQRSNQALTNNADLDEDQIRTCDHLYS
jgi:hypothetical protein